MCFMLQVCIGLIPYSHVQTLASLEATQRIVKPSAKKPIGIGKQQQCLNTGDGRDELRVGQNALSTQAWPISQAVAV